MQKVLEIKFFQGKKKKRIMDSYQESLNKLGREQFLKLLGRGFEVRIAH